MIWCLVDDAAFHDKLHILEETDVVEGVAGY